MNDLTGPALDEMRRVLVGLFAQDSMTDGLIITALVTLALVLPLAIAGTYFPTGDEPILTESERH